MNSAFQKPKDKIQEGHKSNSAAMWKEISLCISLATEEESKSVYLFTRLGQETLICWGSHISNVIEGEIKPAEK